MSGHRAPERRDRAPRLGAAVLPSLSFVPRSLGGPGFAFPFLLLLACQPSPEAAQPPVRKATPAPPSSAAPAQVVSEAASNIALSLGRRPVIRRDGALVDLKDGASLTRAEFDALEIKAASPRAVKAVQEGRLLLGLDEQTPRPLLSEAVPLESIVDEDRELSPGWHTLVSFVRSGEDIELGVAHFQLELALPPATRDAPCTLLAPGGTVFLAPGGSVELIAAPLTTEVTQFEYFVGESASGGLRAPGLETARIVGLPGGDHRVGVRCYGAMGQLLGRSERIVTINPVEEPSRPH